MLGTQINFQFLEFYGFMSPKQNIFDSSAQYYGIWSDKFKIISAIIKHQKFIFLTFKLWFPDLTVEYFLNIITDQSEV